jgi:hypothetical protein
MRENGHHNHETGKYQQETDGQGPRDDETPKHTSRSVPLDDGAEIKTICRYIISPLLTEYELFHIIVM